MTRAETPFSRAKADRPRLKVDAQTSLVPIVAGDVTDAYVAGLNDPEVHAHLVGPRLARQTHESVEGYVRANAGDPNAILFGVHVEGELRGTLRLHDYDEAQAAAFVGIALFDKRVWGRGIAGLCLSHIVEWCGAAGIRTLRAGIFPANTASANAFARAGFARESAKTDPTFGTVEIWRAECGQPTVSA